jgi:hypothetical protein
MSFPNGVAAAESTHLASCTGRKGGKETRKNAEILPVCNGMAICFCMSDDGGLNLTLARQYED